MGHRQWIAIGALWAALAVGLGAFGAHGLRERLAAAGMLETWRTAVRYQMWHALGLIVIAMPRERWSIGPLPCWCFLLGSLLFSGSLYGLCLGGPKGVLGPVTPFGGLGLIVGWVAFAVQLLQSRRSGLASKG